MSEAKEIRALQSDSVRESLRQHLETRMEQYRQLTEAMRDRAPDRQEIEALSERLSFTETALQVFSGDDDWPPEDLAAWPAWVAAALLKVPAKHRASARIEIEGSEYQTTITVTYDRDETDKEWAARKADIQRRAALAATRKEETERAEFARLQAKYR